MKLFVHCTKSGLHNYVTTTNNIILLNYYYSVLLLFSASEAVTGGYFGPGSGDVLFRSFGCFGDEANLLDCYHNSYIQFCTHSSDAGVICHPGGT